MKDQFLNGLFDHAKTAASRRTVLGGMLAMAAAAALPQPVRAAIPATQKALLLAQHAGQNPFGGLVNMVQAAFCNTGSAKQIGGRERFKSCRQWFTGLASTPYIKLVYFPWGVGNVTGHEEFYGATIPITVPITTATFNGITVIVTFNGQQSHTFSPVGFCEMSDPILASSFGLPFFPPNAAIVIKHYYDILTSTDSACVRVRGSYFTQRLNYAIANEPAGGITTEMMNGNPFTFPSSAQPQSVFGPNMIIGAPTSAMNSYIVPGDSFTADGVGDSPLVANDPNGGWTTRALINAGEAFIIHGLGGRGIYHSIQNGTFTKELLYASNIALIPQGGNDISNGHNAAKLIADMKTFSGWCRAAGHRKVIWGTINPRISDGTPANNNTLFRCTDLANQTPYYTQIPSPVPGQGYGVGQDKDIYNSTIIANKGTGNGWPDDVIDNAAATTDTVTSSKYKVPTTPFSSTLAAAAAQNANSVSLAAAPTVGDSLVFNVGSANVEPVQGDTSTYTVIGVTGSGPFTVALTGLDTWEGGGQFFGRLLGNALSSGAVVKNTWAMDETHFNQPLIKIVAEQVAAPKIKSFAIVNALDPDANTLIQSFATTPNQARIDLINNTIIRWKQWDIWTHILSRGFLAAHEKAAAYRNWKSPGTFDVVDGVAPTFTVDTSIQGDGSTQYCTINGLDWTARDINSMHAGAICLTAATSAGWEIGSLNGLLRVSGRSGANGSVLLSGASSTFYNPGAATPYYSLGVRREISGVGDGVVRPYANGVANPTASVAVTTNPNQITLLRSTTQFTARPLAFYTIGDGQLSDTQIAADFKIIRGYLGPNGLNLIP